MDCACRYTMYACTQRIQPQTLSIQDIRVRKRRRRYRDDTAESTHGSRLNYNGFGTAGGIFGMHMVQFPNLLNGTTQNFCRHRNDAVPAGFKAPLKTPRLLLCLNSVCIGPTSSDASCCSTAHMAQEQWNSVTEDF